LRGVHPTDDLKRLTDWFLSNGDKTVVALSGGVDSAVLALAAKRAFGNNALSVTANYKTLSYQELSAARKVAREIGIKHKVIKYSELESSDFVKNDQLRCYHCRKELGLRLVNEANKFKTNLVVDGTNLDDLKEYRPGITGLKENGVRSPFLELGIDKSVIRAIAQHFGLSVYDKPSNACLASRIPHGTPVTYEKLRRIEKSEIIVMKIFNIRQVRVRDHGDIARIEVGKEELTKLFDVDKLAIIDCRLKELGFKFVAIDAGGYRTGRLVVIR
jgi:pyridinium-3,5-biscarboxylic acid mononucleotide sulfurtransferase